MTMLRKRSILLMTFVIIATGCASNSELRRVEAEAREARRIADQALNTANEARDVAQAGDARSRKTEEMVNRSYRKSMYK